MRTLLKRFIVVLVSVFSLGSTGSLEAQGTFEAVSFTLPSIVGFDSQGVGWTFVPTSDLLVTSVSSSAPQVNFWLGTNQVVASYNVTLGAGDYQPVSPMILLAGQQYAISATGTNLTVYYVFGPNPEGSVYGPSPFNISPYLSQFASYLVSGNGDWSPLRPPPDHSSYLPYGANFQFQVVPEPTSGVLFAMASGIWVFSFWHRLTGR